MRSIASFLIPARRFRLRNSGFLPCFWVVFVWELYPFCRIRRVIFRRYLFVFSSLLGSIDRYTFFWPSSPRSRSFFGVTAPGAARAFRSEFRLFNFQFCMPRLRRGTHEHEKWRPNR